MSATIIRKNYNRSNYSFANINFQGPCNMNCFFCIGKEFDKIENNSLEVPPENLPNLRSYLELCKSNGIKKIYLTGQNTDPLMYKYLDELIDIVQEEFGLVAGLRTNGILAKEKIATINKCKGEISYTVLSLNSETLYRMTGARKVPDYAEILRKTKSPKRVSTVLTRYNQDELDTIVSLAAKAGAEYVQVRRISTDIRYDFLSDHIRAFDKKLADIKTEWEKVDEFELSPVYKSQGVNVSFWKTVETSVNSLNYFTDEVISDNYFIVEGYLNKLG
ncbi:radical SAM protein [Candidatus Woesearchaeota archaeon]|jgi:MoaA/NifB/PqqE/SkfB family radical SAM enzyme|nr:radical SAM protein [Candidatus Woesearchaeota archaeon]MBT6519080.1 radical SAM protein [Candidatus Woesearchaeota archaeon]MBT7367023.1 radical SAM protein [Candidatus Woesearchaeota archaeon]